VLRRTLIRHANAEWKDSNIDDFERPLNPRGVREAESIGKRLLTKELVPDLMLVSAARRTSQTAEILSRMLGLPAGRVQHADQLYLAGPSVILALAQTTAPTVSHVAIVGHNPGISELARSLAPEGAHVAELSTGSACTLTFDVESWVELAAGAAHATRYDPSLK
jgi:phosphohistidine phosphatase